MPMGDWCAGPQRGTTGGRWLRRPGDAGRRECPRGKAGRRPRARVARTSRPNSTGSSITWSGATGSTITPCVVRSRWRFCVFLYAAGPEVPAHRVDLHGRGHRRPVSIRGRDELAVVLQSETFQAGAGMPWAAMISRARISATDRTPASISARTRRLSALRCRAPARTSAYSSDTVHIRRWTTSATSSRTASLSLSRRQASTTARATLATGSPSTRRCPAARRVRWTTTKSCDER